MTTITAADLFCGAGGASTGLRRACKALNMRSELLAVNHWPVAIATHTLNHPDVRHLCESIERIDPREQVPSGRLNLLIAAPECTFFSSARGGRPVNDQQRAQPWLILKWLQELYIDNVLIENVPEFREWGPIGANGKPLKSKKGQTFAAFIEAIRSLGYTVEHRVLNAADYGDPTTRRRLFIMARRGRKAINWPVPTHSKDGGRHLFGSTQKWRAAREVIDWSVKGESIFTRKRPLSPKTMARVMAGLERFGGRELQPFLIVLRNNMGGRSLDAPLPTVAANGQHLGVVEPFLMPVTHGSDTSKRERPVSDPLPTITGANRGELALVEPFVLQQQSGGVPRSTDDPLPTIAADGAQMLVEPFLVNTSHGQRLHDVNQPVPTITTAKGGELAVVEPFIVPPRGFSQHDKVDSVDDPLRTIVAASGHTFAVVEPFLVPHYGERPGQPPRTHSVDEPVPTIPATGDGKFEVVQPFIVSAGGPKVGPISTEEPMNTVLTRDHMAVVEPFLASYYGTQNISPVSDPVPTVTTKDRFALVMPVVNGRALDIRLRMLKPRELAKAMSFDDDYTFTGTQGDQVKQIGNAIPCGMVQALVTSLLRDYAKGAKRDGLEATA